jgi:hypothetical protein
VQLAREINEAIAEIGRKFEVGDGSLDFFCECGEEGCLERVPRTLPAFESLRAASEPLLVDGHLLVRAAEAKSRGRSATAAPIRRARNNRPAPAR